MQEESDLNPQKVNFTLARFYEWVKQYEKKSYLNREHKASVKKIEREKDEIASYTL